MPRYTYVLHVRQGRALEDIIWEARPNTRIIHTVLLTCMSPNPYLLLNFSNLLPIQEDGEGDKYTTKDVDMSVKILWSFVLEYKESLGIHYALDVGGLLLGARPRCIENCWARSSERGSHLCSDSVKPNVGSHEFDRLDGA